MVHLEDAKLRIRVAMSEGIEACTQKNILRNTLGNGAGKRVFSVATACDDEGAKGVREAYGANYPRLAAIKAALDPKNLFRLNQNIAPAT